MNEKAEETLYQIWKWIGGKLSPSHSDRMVAPLRWYVVTGRASGEFVRVFSDMRKGDITAVARILMKCGGFDYDASINAVKKYLGVEV